MSVVGGKLRVNSVGHAEQFFGATNIGYIGCRLAGIHGKVIQAFNLCTFDFGIPVCALHQSYHDLSIKGVGQCV